MSQLRKGRAGMPKLTLLVVLSVALFAEIAVAQQAPGMGVSTSRRPVLAVVDPHHVDGSNLGDVVDLSHAWLLKAGDDSHWADPSLDDSSWTVLQPGRPLETYGFPHASHLWYRSRVDLRPGMHDVSLLVRNFSGSADIFINGVKVGSVGRPMQGGEGAANFDQAFPVPAAALAEKRLSVAIRASVARATEFGRRDGGIAFFTQVLLVPTRQLPQIARSYIFQNYTSNTVNILVETLVPILALALALTLPREREYLALAVSFAAAVTLDICAVWRPIHNSPATLAWFFLSGVLNTAFLIGSLEFVRVVLGLRRSRWWIGYEWLLGVLLIAVMPWITNFFSTGSTGPRNSTVLGLAIFSSVVQLPFLWGLPLLALWVWWKRRNRDALLLFIPLLLSGAVQYVQIALFLLNRLHITELTRLPNVPASFFLLQWSEVTNLLYTLTLLLFLVLRTVRIARSRAAMASDLHAVQTVQQLLLARSSHETSGFRVEHAYYPASEVGGDFFLVSPGQDGSVTAIVGDVSGKGLVAAMRVSMILGVLRREEQREPEAVLRGLNDALLLQGEMGFTTACCVRIRADGHYTAANAGHIAPYVNGKEVLTSGSLPLGILGQQTYEQISGILSPGETLVMLSDGVVEARSAKGELFGFERLAEMTRSKAEDIAEAARRFGQEDDITVLTVMPLAARA